MDADYPFTGPSHRKAIRERLMRWVGMACLIGGCAAAMEAEAMLTLALAVLGLAWLVAAKIAS